MTKEFQSSRAIAQDLGSLLSIAQPAAHLARSLNAVPESLWWLFGADYLGYTGGRSFDKWRGTPR